MCLADSASGGVNVSDGCPSADDGGGGHGCGLGIVGRGWSGESGDRAIDTRVAMRVAEECIAGMMV